MAALWERFTARHRVVSYLEEGRERVRRAIATLPLVEPMEPIRVAPRPGRSQPCPCGSGRKHKQCCGRA